MEKFELLRLCIESNYVFIMQIHRYSQVGQLAKRTQADQVSILLTGQKYTIFKV
jgi:hypothetical protein